MTGPELRQIRESLGWTQEELAERLYISQEAVSRMETGQTRITERRERQIRDVVEREAA